MPRFFIAEFSSIPHRIQSPPVESAIFRKSTWYLTFQQLRFLVYWPTMHFEACHVRVSCTCSTTRAYYDENDGSAFPIFRINSSVISHVHSRVLNCLFYCTRHGHLRYKSDRLISSTSIQNQSGKESKTTHPMQRPKVLKVARIYRSIETRAFAMQLTCKTGMDDCSNVGLLLESVCHYTIARDWVDDANRNDAEQPRLKGSGDIHDRFLFFLHDRFSDSSQCHPR
jgi:hypothetical protein